MMQICPNCGNHNPPNVAFCSQCGFNLHPYQMPPKKQGLPVPAIIGICVAVVFLLFGGLYLIGSNNDPEYKSVDKLELADIEGTWDLVAESKSNSMTEQIKISEDKISFASGDSFVPRYSSVTDGDTLIISDSDNIFNANIVELRLEKRKIDNKDRVVLAVYVDEDTGWGYYIRK